MLQGIGITPVHMFFSSKADLKWYLMLCLYLPSVTESTCLLDLSPDGESAASHSSRRWCSSSLCGLSSGPSVPCWPVDLVGIEFPGHLFIPCVHWTLTGRGTPSPNLSAPILPRLIWLSVLTQPLEERGSFFRVLLPAVLLNPGASQTSLQH